MKSFTFLIFLLPFIFSDLSAQNYNLDTLSRSHAAPGVVYTKFREASAPNIIYMMEIDLKNPNIKMETAKGKNLKLGLEKPSAMAQRSDSMGHRVIGIVNSDFFLSTGEPDNMQVIKGEITRKQRSNYSVVGFDTTNRFMLEYPSFKGSIITKNNIIAINDVDEVRAANSLNIYNSYYGSSTGTQTSGTEAVLSPVGPWFVNDTVRCIVKSITKTTGNTQIGKTQLVLSAHGKSDSILTANVRQGDTIGVYIGVGSTLQKIRELVGGRPIFYKNGVFDSVTASKTTVMLSRNPRTIVGFSKDSTKCFILVVDGRQSFSVGMDMYEMAKLMKTLNIYTAMNFDGGGSAVMVLNNNIQNSPSDGAERSVSNALMVVSTAPQNIKSVNISQKTLRIFRGEKLTFSATGVDEYNNKVTLPVSKIQYSCSSAFGSISQAGTFTAGNHIDSGYVYAQFNNLKDSCFVKVYDLKYFQISPKSTVTDSLKLVKLYINTFDSDSVKHDLALSEFKWISSNPSVGTVDSIGNFRGLKSGLTNVIASCSNYSDTCYVRVEIGKGIITFDPLDNLSGWTFSEDNLDSLKVTLSTDQKSQGNASFKIDYKLTYNAQLQNNYLVYLNKDIPVFGIPDSIFLDVKSDGRRHKLFYRFADDNNELFRASGKKYLDNSLVFDRVHGPLYGMTALYEGSAFNYPLILKRIEIQLAGVAVEGQATSGTIFVDNLRIKYPGEVTALEDKPAIPAEFSLKQNYPNPFNPSTIIRFGIAKSGLVELKIYDILGREVVQLINMELTAGYHNVSFNASGLPSGIYICRLQSDGRSLTMKMILLR